MKMFLPLSLLLLLCSCVADYQTDGDDPLIQNTELSDPTPSPTPTPTPTPLPMKKTFVSASTDGNIGGIAGADTKCMNDAQAEVGKTYKAMIIDGVNRVACTTPMCNTGGSSEHVDWVLQPNTEYYRIDGTTLIGETNNNGLFIIPLTNTYKYDAGTHRLSRIWSGLSADWRGSGATCSGWTSAAAIIGSHAAVDATSSQAVYWSSQGCDYAGNYLLCVEQ